MADQKIKSDPTDAAPAAAADAGPAFPQFAVEAADRQIDKVGGALTDAADAIDGVFENNGLPGAESMRKLAGSASGRLRDLGQRADDLDAAQLMADAQQAAAKRPALAIAAGAAVGAVLASLIVWTAPRATATAEDVRDGGAGR